MTDRDKTKDILDKEYEELVLEIKKELPNIVIPSMGMYNDVKDININGKDFVVGNEEV